MLAEFRHNGSTTYIQNTACSHECDEYIVHFLHIFTHIYHILYIYLHCRHNNIAHIANIY